MTEEQQQRPTQQEKKKQDKILAAKKSGQYTEKQQKKVSQEHEQEEYEKLVESRRLREIQILQDLHEIRDHLYNKGQIQLLSMLTQLMKIQYSKIEKEQIKYELVKECYLLIIDNYLIQNPKINECNDFITTIFRDYNTGCPKLCEILLTTLFDNILDLQTNITPNINRFPNIENFLSRQLEFHLLNKNEQYLALVIIICNNIIQSLSFNLTYIQLIRELLVKLIRTTSYFARVKETLQLIKYIDKNLIISEEMSEQDKKDCQICISELRVDIVPCVLNLPIQNVIFENMYKSIEYLPQNRYQDHLNNVIKFLSIEKEWVSMCYALRVYIQIFGFSKQYKNYAIEALILAYCQQSGLSKIKITDELKYVCLQSQLQSWLDATCSNSSYSTIVEQSIQYLLTYGQFSEEFLSYCQKYLAIDYSNYENYKIEEFIKQGIETIHGMAKKARIYCMYSNQQVYQIVSNAVFYHLTSNSNIEFDVKDLYQQIRQCLLSINKDYCQINYKQFKLMLVNLVKYHNKQIKINYKKNVIYGIFDEKKQIDEKVSQFMKQKLQFNIQQEKAQCQSLQVKLDKISQREQDIIERIKKINEENERKEQERQEQLKLYHEEKQKLLKEKLKREREQKITINQCQVFIEEASILSANPNIQVLLQNKLNEMIADPQIPLITYVNELSVYYNQLSNQEISQRQQQCQQEEQKQLYQQYNKKYISKEQLLKNAQECQDKENKIISECADARYQYDMEQYQQNIEFINKVNSLPNLEQVRNDCDRIVNVKYYQEQEQYDKKFTEVMNRIRDENQRAIQEAEALKKKKEEEIKQKKEKGKSKLEQLKALRAQKKLQQNRQ